MQVYFWRRVATSYRQMLSWDFKQYLVFIQEYIGKIDKPNYVFICTQPVGPFTCTEFPIGAHKFETYEESL